MTEQTLIDVYVIAGTIGVGTVIGLGIANGEDLVRRWWTRRSAK